MIILILISFAAQHFFYEYINFDIEDITKYSNIIIDYVIDKNNFLKNKIYFYDIKWYIWHSHVDSNLRLITLYNNILINPYVSIETYK